jgi:hypothetical protein
MILSDLSITISQRRWPCVLDPTLVLSRFGLPLIRHINEAMELWIVRELWHILDNSRFWLEQPEALFSEGREGVSPDHALADDRELTSAMKAWERIRMENDLSGLKLYWLNDCLSDSMTPAGQPPDLVPRFEALACALDRHLVSTGPMACAARDSAALAAALGTAFVLTCQSAAERAEGTAPAICRMFPKSIACLRVSEDDPVAAIERDHLRRLLVHAGAANMLFAGLYPVIIHFSAPAASFGATLACDAKADSDDIEPVMPAEEFALDPWQGARAFWYPL